MSDLEKEIKSILRDLCFTVISDWFHTSLAPVLDKATQDIIKVMEATR